MFTTLGGLSQFPSIASGPPQGRSCLSAQKDLLAGLAAGQCRSLLLDVRKIMISFHVWFLGHGFLKDWHVMAQYPVATNSSPTLGLFQHGRSFKLKYGRQGVVTDITFLGCQLLDCTDVFSFHLFSFSTLLAQSRMSRISPGCKSCQGRIWSHLALRIWRSSPCTLHLLPQSSPKLRVLTDIVFWSGLICISLSIDINSMVLCGSGAPSW